MQAVNIEIKKTRMTDPEFWQLIALIDVSALDDNREDQAIEPLEAALSSKAESELFAFEEVLSQKLYSIDGEEFGNNAGDSGGSDDGFLYARCYVVARGREFFEAVKSNPKRMPKSIDQWCEDLLYPHRIAWARQTGNDQGAWPYEATVSYETGSNQDLWPN